MAHYSGGGERRWRSNRHKNYSSQSDNYSNEFGPPSGPGVPGGPRRNTREDYGPVYDRENDHRMLENGPWEGNGSSSHSYYSGDVGRQRNDHAVVQPSSGQFAFADRSSAFGWGVAENNPSRYQDNSVTRDDGWGTRIHHNKQHNRGHLNDMSQQWNGSLQDSFPEWRERNDGPSANFHRGRQTRPMDWEPAYADQGWPEQHMAQSNQGFQQHQGHSQASWNNHDERSEGHQPRSQFQGRQSQDARSSYPHQNRRNHGFQPHRHTESHNFNRSTQRDRGYPNSAPRHSFSNHDEQDSHPNESPTKGHYNKKSEKRRYSRSRSADSNREQHRSQSPKRRRRESPLTSKKGTYNRRSRSRESKHSSDQHHERAAGGYKRDHGTHRRDNGRSKDNYQFKRNKNHDNDRGGYHKHDRGKQRKDYRQRSPSRSASSRSQTPHSRSRSLSRSSSRSRSRRRHDDTPVRQRSPSRSRSRSPTSPIPSPSSKSKGNSMKHRLPAKTIPRMPLLKDVPLAQSRAGLPPSVARPGQQASMSTTQAQQGSGGISTMPKVPPTGPRGIAGAGSQNESIEAQSTLSHFFPDAAPRISSEIDPIPKLAPVANPSGTLSLLDRIGDVKAKKSKARMVPIGGAQPNTDSAPPVQPLAPPTKVGPVAAIPAESTAASSAPDSAINLTDPKLSPKTDARESPKPTSPVKTAPPSPKPTPTAEALLPPVQKPKKPEELYKILTQVGEGTFGKVYKARNQLTGLHVALKRIRMEGEKDGFPVTAMREIKLLQSLKHENVVMLHEMMVSKGLVYMVFEYGHHDLVGVLQQTQFELRPQHLKELSQQMLSGLAYLHFKGIIHRDLKASNILVNSEGKLKLADFGLARFYNKRRQADYTNRVITLWYRPPELLFGATVYGPEVDLWSAGCIFLELFVKKAIFQGNDEIHQLEVIFRVMGTPSIEQWPNLPSLPWYELLKPTTVMDNIFQQSFKRWLSQGALDLAERMLAFDPAQRITAANALLENYFTSEEPAAQSLDLSTLEGEWHELEAKRAKKRRRAEMEMEAAEVGTV
ncbi:Pkinase-domain-containing protein [Serendipita vermifera]|nr:Pkinase-domain-containing protein [Serendipita vermifera]